jgi:allantoicase
MSMNNIEYFESGTNIASALMGAKVVFATDEYFAAAENCLIDEDPVWKEDDFTEYGKWMDGWESRRKRTEGNDWCIIELSAPGVLNKIMFDTMYFSGNYSPMVSVDTIYPGVEELEAIRKLIALRAASIKNRPNGRMGMSASAEELLLANQICRQSQTSVPWQPLGAGVEATRKTSFEVLCNHGRMGPEPMSYLRINMGPDGGIARIRAYANQVMMKKPTSEEEETAMTDARNKELDMAATENGGIVIACNNRHYGHPANLLKPGRGLIMSDGWETARNPKRPQSYGPSDTNGFMAVGDMCSWATILLGIQGVVSSIDIDTNLYKGNFPESCVYTSVGLVV